MVYGDFPGKQQIIGGVNAGEHMVGFHFPLPIYFCRKLIGQEDILLSGRGVVNHRQASARNILQSLRNLRRLPLLHTSFLISFPLTGRQVPSDAQSCGEAAVPAVYLPQYNRQGSESDKMKSVKDFLAKKIRRYSFTESYVTVSGVDEVLLENVSDVFECNEIMVRVKAASNEIIVWGERLKVENYVNKSVVVRGKISSVELSGRGVK